MLRTAYSSDSQTILVTDPFWLQQITTDPHILVPVHMKCTDEGYAKLKTYISQMILVNHENTPVTYVAMQCMIWSSLKITVALFVVTGSFLTTYSVIQNKVNMN
jgi:hypothetical protein